MKNQSDISIFQGASIIAGLSIGSGVMAVPYFFVQNHWVLALGMVLLAFLLCAMLNFMIAEVALRSNKDYQIVELYHEYLFQNAPVWLIWLVFIFTILNFYLALLGFTVAANEILADLTGFSTITMNGIVFFITAVPILFGLKTLAVSDSIAVILILVIISIMTFFSIQQADVPLRIATPNMSSMLGVYAMASFALIGIVSVPQVVTGMKVRRTNIPKAILLGLGINVFLITSIALSVSITTAEVTEVAIIGWGKELGGMTQKLGTLFVLLAIVTSYWGTAYGAAIVYQQRTKINYPLAWALVVVPTLMIPLFVTINFIEIMQATAAILAVILIFSIIPMYRAAVANTPNYTGFHLGFWGNTFFQILVIIGFVMVIIGSVT